MALTNEQKAEVVTRLGNKEKPKDIIAAMGISKQDFRAARKEALGIQDSDGRLANLQRRKTQLEERLAFVQAEIDAIEAEA